MRFNQTNEILHTKGNNGVKRQPTEWKKIFTSYTTTKWLISRATQQQKPKNSK